MMTDSTTLLHSITMNGEAVTQLYPGWVATSRHTVIAGFDVVLFTETATERQACWWLYGDAYRSSHFLTLPHDDQETLLTALIPSFQPLTDGVLSASPMPEAKVFRADLPLVAVRELSAAWLNHSMENVLLIPPGHAESGEALECPNGVIIPEGRITSLMQTRPPSGGVLVLSSPFSTAPLRAQIVLDLQDHTAYRFHDTQDDIVFYLAWSKADSSVGPIFYYPKGRLLISSSPVAAFIPEWIIAWFAQHPEHSTWIQEARPFLPEDFGVGRASTSRLRPLTEPSSTASVTHTPQDTAPQAPEPYKPATASQAWPDFLPNIPHDPATTEVQEKTSNSFFQRMKKRFTHTK